MELAYIGHKADTKQTGAEIDKPAPVRHNLSSKSF